MVPISRYVPSEQGSARVVISANEEPACGSDRHMVPRYRPSTIGTSQFSICSAEAYSANSAALAAVNSRYDDVDGFAAWISAIAERPTHEGRCMPPSSGANGAAINPELA